MIIAAQRQQKLTFEQFLEHYPEDGRYELVDGELVRILATRRHENVADFVQDALKTDGLYKHDCFQGVDRIVSPTFPELILTVAQVLEA
jgi:Uma2 family endonuclease